MELRKCSDRGCKVRSALFPGPLFVAMSPDGAPRFHPEGLYKVRNGIRYALLRKLSRPTAAKAILPSRETAPPLAAFAL
jgi:hypothetical protein